MEMGALAAGQGGFVTRTQLGQLGIPPRTIDRWVASGTLPVFGRGIYRVFFEDTLDALTRGAASTLPEAAVSHESAARAHGFSTPVARRASVTVPSWTTHRFPGVTVHRCLDLGSSHLVEVDGLRITSVPRTLFDLAASVSVSTLDRLVEEVILEGRTTVDELTETLDSLARRGKPGTAALRAVLADRGEGTERSASKLERRGLAVLRESMLPEPVPQYTPPWNAHIRLDVAYPTHGVAIEWDSKRWHSSAERFQSDRERDRDAAQNGWVVLRFTWRDVFDTPAAVVSEVGAVLRERATLAG